ncbi:MAG: hypothetical protein KIT72_06105 [Polyangiaceae bacterium]|nr:hypothetical protein [Polyangiaceae bacterium]MCW5789973.1 hypothetical protein [Polyangiaceae bacterium]
MSSERQPTEPSRRTRWLAPSALLVTAALWGSGALAQSTTPGDAQDHAAQSPAPTPNDAQRRSGAPSLTPLDTQTDDSAEKPKGAGPTCIIRGDSTAPPKDLTLYDAASGGAAIAKLTGLKTPLEASELPETASARARLKTGTGQGHFRMEGYAAATELPLVTSQMLPVITGHVWIGAAERVTLDASRPGQVRVSKRLTAPLSQTFKAWAPCAQLSFTQGTPPGPSIDGDARGYRMAKDTLELYDEAGQKRSHVITLQRAPGAEVLFWSTKRQGNMVQVGYQGAVLIEGWANANALKALPRGELMDEAAPPRLEVAGGKLRIEGEPRELRTTREHYIYREAKQGTPIGRIEVNTDTIVLDIVAGWASVLPKSLAVMPPDGGHFWVKAEDLNLGPKP